MPSNVCEYCGKAFSRLPSVYRHIREVHKLNCTLKELNPENIDKFPCRKSNKCTEKFSSSISRYRHEKKIHKREDDPEEFICDICHLSCRTRLHILQHLKSDHPTTIRRPTTFHYEYGGDLRSILLTDGVQISLPDEYVYEMVKSKRSSSHDKDNNFLADFKFRAATEEAIKTNWIERLEEKNKIFFRKVTVKRSKDENVIFKKRFCCGRNVHIRNKRKSNPKHTNCPFYIFVRIFKQDSRYTAKVRIAHKHNHTIESAESLKFRRVSNHVVEKITNLFHKGSGPLEAYRQHVLDLQTQYGDEFHKIQQDRYSCPHKRWFYQLHEKIFKKNSLVQNLISR